jgi:hypothetical protein
MRKNLFKKSSIVALALFCSSLASCGGQAKTLGSWALITGGAAYTTFDATYSPATGIMVSSSDSVTLYSDNTFVWATAYSYDYSTDKVVWTAGLAYQTLTIYGTNTLTNDKENEEYTLNIKTVTRVVGNGANYKNVDTSVVDETEENGHTKAYNDAIIERFTTCLTNGPYTLDYYASMKGTPLFEVMLKLPKASS